jgi:hypothetical protein
MNLKYNRQKPKFVHHLLKALSSTLYKIHGFRTKILPKGKTLEKGKNSKETIFKFIIRACDLCYFSSWLLFC